MDKREKLILDIMKDFEKDGVPITREEAEQMAEMELKAKKNCKDYVQGEKSERKKSTRERKVDENKEYILKCVKALIEDIQIREDGGECETALKTETELSFRLWGEDYTLKLTKHRKKKG